MTRPAKHRSWRRWVWWSALLVVLGVVTTYGTAWAAAESRSQKSEHRFEFIARGYWWRVYLTEHHGGHSAWWSCVCSVDDGASESEVLDDYGHVHHNESSRVFIDSKGIPFGSHSGWRPPLLVNDEWILDRIVNEDLKGILASANHQLGGAGFERISGWPLVAVEYASVRFGPSHSRADAFWGGIHIGDPIDRTFGLRPVLPGFIINTLFYAALWAAIVFGTRRGWRGIKHWRRRRRGHCPMCAYDLQNDVDGGCSECGWNRCDVPVNAGT